MTTDMLEQRDIEALLKAVEGGAVDLKAEPAETETTVIVYDFRRPERVSKEHIRSLEGLHEAFARNLGSALSAFMRTIVDVRVASVEQITYSEFILLLPNPTCLYLLKVEPMGERLLMELGPTIVFPMLDWMLGGGREPVTIPERPVTEIERRLVGRVVERALKALAESWGAVEEVRFSIEQMETNPPMIQALPAGEVVVLVALEITLGEAQGLLHLAIPFTVVEPLIARLSRADRLTPTRRPPERRHARRIARILARAPVEVVAYLAETTIAVADLIDLRVGDIIKTEKPANETLLVMVEGRPKFRGRPVEHRGRKALVITGRAGSGDRI